MTDKITKSGGHCYDGCGWNYCMFWNHTQDPNDPILFSKCVLFGGKKGVNKYASKALVICDKIYGTDYIGDV